MNTLLTIGYEKSSIEDFIETLKIAGVDVLVDIREVPVSRKKGFSKKQLSMRLSETGILYLHMKDLGDPKKGRDAAKKGDLITFRRVFEEHLKNTRAQQALEEIIDMAAESSVCLLCFERDHRCCHRDMVARELATRCKASVRHIGVRDGASRNSTSDGAQHERFRAIG